MDIFFICRMARISTLFLLFALDQNILVTSQDQGFSNVTEFKVGVIIISDSGTPYDIERAGAAIDLAFEKVNREILNGSYHITQIQKKYGPFCNAEKAPGESMRGFLKSYLISSFNYHLY